MRSRIMAYFRIQAKTYLASRSGIFIALIFPVMMTFIFGSIMPADYLDAIIPGLIGFSILSDSLFSITASTSKYRFMNLFSQLALTPLKRSEWLISVFLWHLMISVVSFIIIVTLAHFVYSVPITLNLLIIPFLVFGTLLFTSMGLLIGNVSRSTENASLLSNAVGFPMMVLTGTFFPVSMLPWYLQEAVKVLPLYYFVQGMGGLMVTNEVGTASLYLLVTLVLSVVFFITGTYFFRWRRD